MAHCINNPSAIHLASIKYKSFAILPKNNNPNPNWEKILCADSNLWSPPCIFSTFLIVP